ncbi:MAG: HNH endonuclease [Bacteroidota bacterium]
MKQLVKERANFCCEYCQALELFATEDFTIEHIFPIAKGGLDDIDNLALACSGCNSHKSTKTEAFDPETQTIVLLFHPRQHNWKDHFTWSDDSITIIGQTDIGRATVLALKMNRQGLRNLRYALTLAEEHPPEHTL